MVFICFLQLSGLVGSFSLEAYVTLGCSTSCQGKQPRSIQVVYHQGRPCQTSSSLHLICKKDNFEISQRTEQPSSFFLDVSLCPFVRPAGHMYDINSVRSLQRSMLGPLTRTLQGASIKSLPIVCPAVSPFFREAFGKYVLVF